MDLFNSWLAYFFFDLCEDYIFTCSEITLHTSTVGFSKEAGIVNPLIAPIIIASDNCEIQQVKCKVRILRAS